MVALPTSVNGCARCGGDHPEGTLEYRAFRQPVPDVDGDFTHWASCPTTGDPILLRRMDERVLEWHGRIAVHVQRLDRDAGEWVTVGGDAAAAFLRTPHEATSVDATFAFIDGAEA